MVLEIEYRRSLRAIIEVRQCNRTIIVQTLFYANSNRSISVSSYAPS